MLSRKRRQDSPVFRWYARGVNSLVWVIMDSCRFDTFERARKPQVQRFQSINGGAAAIERRWSYASFTGPSHFTFLMGMLPHGSPPGIFASEVYKKEFAQWSDRLGVPDMDFSRFLPHLSLPKVLNELGYRTVGRVSLPVLNESTMLSAHFHDYRLMDDHNDFAGMIREMTFPAGKPMFYFFNLGETHYPYMLKDENLPRISGVHGVFRDLGKTKPAADATAGTSPAIEPAPSFFDPQIMGRLHQQQVNCVEYVDDLFGQLVSKCPEGTHIILTADHGELFGEENYFGHGPIMHPKVFEVPFLEGKVRK